MARKTDRPQHFTWASWIENVAQQRVVSMFDVAAEPQNLPRVQHDRVDDEESARIGNRVTKAIGNCRVWDANRFKRTPCAVRCRHRARFDENSQMLDSTSNVPSQISQR